MWKAILGDENYRNIHKNIYPCGHMYEMFMFLWSNLAVLQPGLIPIVSLLSVGVGGELEIKSNLACLG